MFDKFGNPNPEALLGFGDTRYSVRLNAIELQMSALAAEQARLLAAAAHFGNDVYEDGNILTWEKCFDGSERSYAYAAIKAAGRWYVTGSVAPRDGMLWGALVDFMVKGCGGNYPDIYVVETITEVSGPSAQTR